MWYVSVWCVMLWLSHEGWLLLAEVPPAFARYPCFLRSSMKQFCWDLIPAATSSLYTISALRTSQFLTHCIHTALSPHPPPSPFAFPACFRPLPDGAMMQCCVAVLCWRACSHVSGRIMYHIWYYLIIMDHKLKKTEEIEENVRQDRCSCSTIAGHLEPNRYTALQTWKGPFLELLGCYNLVIVSNDGYLKKQATAKR